MKNNTRSTYSSQPWLTICKQATVQYTGKALYAYHSYLYCSCCSQGLKACNTVAFTTVQYRRSRDKTHQVLNREVYCTTVQLLDFMEMEYNTVAVARVVSCQSRWLWSKNLRTTTLQSEMVSNSSWHFKATLR